MFDLHPEEFMAANFNKDTEIEYLGLVNSNANKKGKGMSWYHKVAIKSKFIK